MMEPVISVRDSSINGGFLLPLITEHEGTKGSVQPDCLRHLLIPSHLAMWQCVPDPKISGLHCLRECPAMKPRLGLNE
jgi:hypothetical protein